MSPNDYVPGYSEQEARRLTVQASVIDHVTEGVLRHAGLTSGMEVLDVGSGVGDVAMLAARLVRPNGTVLGLERSAESVAIARRRAVAAGILNVSFVVGEIDRFVPARQFDALTIRLVLLFLPDPAGALRRLAGFIRPGGVVAVQEVDQSRWSTVPQNDLFDRVIGWLIGTMTQSGIEPEMGCRLAEVFRAAGLPAPFMNVAQIAGCQADSPLYQFLADMIRTLLPHIVRLGLASEQEVDIDTLGDRLRREVTEKHLTVFSSRMIGAWTRMPVP